MKYNDKALHEALEELKITIQISPNEEEIDQALSMLTPKEIEKVTKAIAKSWKMKGIKWADWIDAKTGKPKKGAPVKVIERMKKEYAKAALQYRINQEAYDQAFATAHTMSGILSKHMDAFRNKINGLDMGERGMVFNQLRLTLKNAVKEMQKSINISEKEVGDGSRVLSAMKIRPSFKMSDNGTGILKNGR